MHASLHLTQAPEMEQISSCLQILPLAAQAQGKEPLFRVEMAGIIPPWTLDRLCTLVYEIQGGDFSVCFLALLHKMQACVEVLFPNCSMPTAMIGFAAGAF